MNASRKKKPLTDEELLQMIEDGCSDIEGLSDDEEKSDDGWEAESEHNSGKLGIRLFIIFYCLHFILSSLLCGHHIKIIVFFRW